MSTGTDPSRPEPDGLQFDHAEFAQDQAGPTLACAACKRPIAETYYALGQMTVCEDCRGAIGRHFERGPGVVGLLRAVLFGSAAALAGAAIYFAVLWFFDRQMALISILVGFLVGKAVRTGSRDRGGLGYQILAVLMTYLAIGLAFTAGMLATQIQEGMAAAKARANRPVAKAPAAPKADPAAPKADPAAPKAADPAGQADPAEAAEDDDDEAVPALTPAVIGQMAALLIGFTFLSPVLMARTNVLTLAIIGFALWQAWKLNRRARLVVTGPYRVAEFEAGDGAHA